MKKTEKNQEKINPGRINKIFEDFERLFSQESFSAIKSKFRKHYFDEIYRKFNDEYTSVTFQDQKDKYNTWKEETVTLSDFGCFLAGTRIYYTDGSFRAIENIRVGDIISDAYGNDVEVLGLHRVTVREYLFIETFYESIYVTDYHPFLMSDGTFKKISDINTGEYISGDKIIAKTRITNEVDVYNLSVSGSETYIANNFKVHNK